MAGTTWTVSRGGQINATGDTNALFLKVWAGEVLTTFSREALLMGLTLTRSISSGKSAQFPVVGANSASYHVPGVDIDGNVIKHVEKEIFIDSSLISPVIIPSIDEAMTHYDYRSIYTTECGRALALACDTRILKTLIRTARSNANIADVTAAGARITSANMGTDGVVIKGALWAAAQTLDEHNVPSQDRFAAFSPAQFYALLTDADNADILNSLYGGRGNVATGTLPEVAGIQIVKTNAFNQDLSQAAAVTGEVNAYKSTDTSLAVSGVDFDNCKGLVFQRNAVGTVKLLDLATESEYAVRNQATLIVSKMAVGHGTLRPECAIELATA